MRFIWAWAGSACMHIMNMVEDLLCNFPLPLLPLFGGLFGMGLATIVGAFSTRKAGTVFAMISPWGGRIDRRLFGDHRGVLWRRRGCVAATGPMRMPFFGVEFLQQIEVYYLIAVWLMISALPDVSVFAHAGRAGWPMRCATIPNGPSFWAIPRAGCGSTALSRRASLPGIAGALFAINYEILTEENLNTASSGVILLVTFLGGVGFFFGPILGAIVFTLVQTVLSLQTELWAFYAGMLFVATVMFFPGGLAGLIMMHVPAMRHGQGEASGRALYQDAGAGA